MGKGDHPCNELTDSDSGRFTSRGSQKLDEEETEKEKHRRDDDEKDKDENVRLIFKKQFNPKIYLSHNIIIK